MSDHASNDRDDLPRQVDLAIVRVDPWGVMKVAFLLSVALGIALVVAVIILWLMLNAMHVFASAESFLHVHWRIADGLASGLRQASEGHGLHDVSLRS